MAKISKRLNIVFRKKAWALYKKEYNYYKSFELFLKDRLFMTKDIEDGKE